MPQSSEIRSRMRAEHLPDIAIDTFLHYHAQLAAGETGLMHEADLAPVENLPDAEIIPAAVAAMGAAALPKIISLKLNGGLGTGMGLAKAKSLLPVKNDLTFLDIIARQAQSTGVPLLLMNSFSTRDDTLAALAEYPDLQKGDLPLDFLQHKVPKLLQSNLAAATWPQNEDLAWCPPGHGDLYTALLTSGLLEKLLEHGYEYAFVSNSDNLGAVIDAAILGHMIAEDIPFLMEVADRTPADKKGGHLARRIADGRLVLREIAQCPADSFGAFQDITRHRYFNTNSLWLHLPTLQHVLQENDGILGLPMIRNGKTLDPRDPDSVKVWQLETAMGSAIEVFAGADAIRVPPTRFAPIKRCSDLLDVRSDNFVLTDDHRVVPNPERTLGRCVITLDDRYYKFVDDLEMRFPQGPPSLRACASLTIEGDVTFGAAVVATGNVALNNENDEGVTIPSGEVLSGVCRW